MKNKGASLAMNSLSFDNDDDGQGRRYHLSKPDMEKHKSKWISKKLIKNFSN